MPSSAGVVIVERNLQPFESFVCLSATGVNLRDLISRNVSALAMRSAKAASAAALMISAAKCASASSKRR